jgi:hypothetical protein
MPPTSRLATTLLVVVVLACSACGTPPDPLTVDGERIVVLNLSSEDWIDVELRVNRYYRGHIARIAAGGRLDAPLARFQGGYGYYFDRKRERLKTVELTARTASGKPVTLAWPAGEGLVPAR